MLPEEKELLAILKQFRGYHAEVNGKHAALYPTCSRLITALVRAVREDCAKVAETHSMRYFRDAVKDDSTYNRARNEVAKGVAAAIRGRK